MKIPPGLSLLLTGSGLYWILSSQLIASFTVITPGIFSSNPNGVLLVLVVGILSTGTGLWNINDDLNGMLALFDRMDGWLYLIPLLLSSGDVIVTLIGLSSSSGAVELNPQVASAVQAGSPILAAFTISYLTLSAGLTLLVLHTGQVLFPSRSSRFLPFGMICGAASFGFLNNLIVLTLPPASGFSITGAAFGAILLSVVVFALLVRGDNRLTKIIREIPRLDISSNPLTSD